MGTPLQFIIASVFRFSSGTTYWCRQHLEFYASHLFSTSFLLIKQENGKGKLLPLLISSRPPATAGSWGMVTPGRRGHSSVQGAEMRSSCFQLTAVPAILAGLQGQEGSCPSSILNPSSGFDRRVSWQAYSLFPSLGHFIFCETVLYLYQGETYVDVDFKQESLSMPDQILTSLTQIFQMQVHSQGQGLNELRNALQGKACVP